MLETTLARPGYWVVLLAWAVSLAACGSEDREAERPPPHILWINCEDIGPNLGAYGDSLARTPNLDRLAAEGVRYTQAFATAPICSPARSALITGLYATALGTQHLRGPVDLPPEVRAFPEYLREIGYFTTNYAKTDYNFDPEGIFDYWERDVAPWRARTDDDQPFFSYFVLGMTHEGPTNDFDRWAEQVRDLPPDQRHDPADVSVPPYHPDTEKIRTAWAHYHDNISLMDRMVGRILDSLARDGLADRTIVFFFSDHGAGLPRHKRWLNASGLKVPLIVYAPPRYQDWLTALPGQAEDRLVSFVDFAPTTLRLAGAPIPESMQGQPFLGPDPAPERALIFGARSRADNMYELSRAASDGRFLYVRHYLPHLPYIQPGIIFSDLKVSYAEFHQARSAGTLPPAAARLFEPKPREELYDLSQDPYEISNLAGDEAYREVRDSLRTAMQAWMLDHGDTGLLPEAEIMYRAMGSTPYATLRAIEPFERERLLAAMELVGAADEGRLLMNLRDANSGVRYWAVIALQARGEGARGNLPDLRLRLEDPSPAVQIAAAETMCRLGACQEALPVLLRWANDDRGWLALYAARSLELLGDRACAVRPQLQALLDRHAAQEADSRIRTRDYNFSAFIYWSIEYALLNCGEGEAPASLY